MFGRGLGGPWPIAYLCTWEVSPWWGGGKQRKHMRDTYKARGQANSATFYEYQGSSKSEVIKTIRQQTEAKRLPGYTSSWTVRRQDGTVVAAGGVDSDNIRYRIPDDYLDRLGKHY